MSWYIKYLLQNSTMIENSLADFDDSVLNDLIILESEIGRQADMGVLDSTDLLIIDLFKSGEDYRSIGLAVNLDKMTVMRLLRTLTKSLSFVLGGRFTDEGFFEYMQEKYNLTAEEENKLLKILFLTEEDN